MKGKLTALAGENRESDKSSMTASTVGANRSAEVALLMTFWFRYPEVNGSVAGRILVEPSRRAFKELVAARVLHIDHLFACMQRLDTYEAKTKAMTRIGSNLSQVLPPPFICE